MMNKDSVCDDEVTDISFISLAYWCMVVLYFVYRSDCAVVIKNITIFEERKEIDHVYASLQYPCHAAL